MTSPTMSDLEAVLWDHQVRAVELIRRYIAAYKRGSASGSGLIRFPTGTGKTGVIAVATLLLAPPGVSVIVCPSTALRDQLCDEVNEDLWRKLGVGRPRPTAAVEMFTPSTLGGILERTDGKRAVLVTTAQSLAQVRRVDRDTFAELASRTSFVVFDEGHREPAQRWGEACRELQAPCVLFSATPYRNDYALFEIESEFVESLSFHEALQYRCIRNVEVHEVEFADVAEFAAQVLSNLDAHGEDARAIVRCDTKDSVLRMTRELQRRGATCVGIHDRFKSAGNLRSRVPSKREDLPARVWVHQNKLLEGIDDPRFVIVAIFSEFGNARSLVQQVGRVIRNPGRKPTPAAVLLAHRDGRQPTFWNNYLAFERSYDPKLHDVRDLIYKAIEDQPEYRYLEDDFRKVFDPRAPDFVDHLRFRRSANIFRIDDSALRPAPLADAVVSEWDQEDRILLNRASPSPDTEIILYAEARNSPILLSRYYIEDRLGFTVLHRAGDWLFYYDSQSKLSEVVQKQVLPAPAPRLHRLFGADSRTVALSMRNTDIGQHSLRRRTVHAYSLADAATGLSDHGYLCSTAQGYVAPAAGGAPGVRRYLGITRGRLAETGSKQLALPHFVAWAGEKAKLLSSSAAEHNAVFRRFAAHTDPPTDPEPRHILLDIDEYVSAQAYRTRDAGHPIVIDELAVPVDGGKCEVVANGETFEVTVAYDTRAQRYHLEAKSLDDAYVRDDVADRYRRGLIAQMNIDQAFRVVPSDGWTIYAHGHFVKPTSGLGANAGSGLDLLGVITDVPALGRLTSEKGGPGSASPQAGWSTESVFGLLDTCGRGRPYPSGAKALNDAMSGIDLMVCDDMSKESADFICGSIGDRRLIVVHAKYKDSSRSASALHEVCSQATKNLGLLQPFSDAQPRNLTHWGQTWSATAPQGKKHASIGEVPRIRVGGKKEAIWRQMARLRRDPATTREVWLVLGKTMKLSWLRKQQKKADPTAEAIQTFYLLQSLWTAVTSIGAKLRVFTADSWA